MANGQVIKNILAHISTEVRAGFRSSNAYRLNRSPLTIFNFVRLPETKIEVSSLLVLPFPVPLIFFAHSFSTAHKVNSLCFFVFLCVIFYILATGYGE